MKKMLSVICIIIIILFSVACGKNKTAMEAVGDYLDLYINNDEIVINQLDDFVNKEDLTNEQKELYKEAIIREYSAIEYEIVSERYEDNYAFIDTSISVIDLNKAQKDAFSYFLSNEEEFKDENGIYDNGKYTTFKLNKMKEEKEFINYNITFKVMNNDGNWEVTQLSNEDLEKIHGIYSKN